MESRERNGRRLARELGLDVGDQAMILGTDSSAAKSFVARRGLGKMRHIEVRDLWLQEEVRKGDVVVEKILGTDNPADLMTKFLHMKEIEHRLGEMGMVLVRSEVKKGREVKGGGESKMVVRKRWADVEEGEEEKLTDAVGRRPQR